jgi:putative transport protein
MDWIKEQLSHSPEILLFLSLAIGFWVGQWHFGRFQLGGVAGSLLVAVLLSLFGVHLDNGVKSLLFALFIYAVGFESGPRFFKSLGPQSLKEIGLAVFMAAAGLATVLVMAKMFSLDKGLAAGLAAGGMTQSAIIGTAGDAISRLGLAADEVRRLQANVAVGYAVTYVFGTLGAIIVCVNILPRFMGKDLRDDAIKAEAERLKGSMEFGPGQAPAVPEIIGRIFRVEGAAGRTVAEIEEAANENILTVERIKRADRLVEVTPQTTLQSGDIVLIVGRRSGVVPSTGQIGTELQSSNGMDVVMRTDDVVMRNTAYANRTLGEIRKSTSPILKHGVFLLGMKRDGDALTLSNDLAIKVGDTLTVYGTDQDLKRVVSEVGVPVTISNKTDWVFHGAGLVVGLVIGLIVIRISNVPLTLGAGGGALLSGLLFGWLRNRNQTTGNMPLGASQLLKDLGLAGFVAAVGLQSGSEAIETIARSGLSLFLIGVVVTLVPLLLSMAFGRYVLRYDNAAIFAGALSGSRSANPAFGEVLNKAGNTVPTVPFAITYALANVFLTLLGPLIVAFA